MHCVEKTILSATMLHRIHIVLCSQAISAVLGECGWLVNKMAALGYVYTLKHTLRSPKRLDLNATGTNFIEVQSSYMIGAHMYLLSSARSVQNFGTKKNKKYERSISS